jgi:hypothetical protein
MTAAATALAVVLVVFFTSLGTAKMLAVPPIHQMTAHVGFTTAAYLAVLWGGIR